MDSKDGIGPGPRKSILYIDTYGFSYNMEALLESALDVTVHVMFVDSIIYVDLQTYAGSFDAVVVGPGPGLTTLEQLWGIKNSIWELNNIPVLGIDSGFRSLCCHYGAELKELPQSHCEKFVQFIHCGNDLFNQFPKISITLDKSVCVAISHQMEISATLSRRRRKRWTSSEKCPELTPLGWAMVEDNSPGAVLIAVRHRSKPLWGLQFHPEPCRFESSYRDLLRNWWKSVNNFNDTSRPPFVRQITIPICDTVFFDGSKNIAADEVMKRLSTSCRTVSSRYINQNRLTAENICEIVDIPYSPGVVLDINSRYSVISALSSGAWTLQYSLDDNKMRVTHPHGRRKEATFSLTKESFWDILRQILTKKKAKGGDPEIPFWGGFLGLFSYEMGIAPWGSPPPKGFDGDQTYDACLLWVERSIVIDHNTKTVHIQSIRHGDNQPGEWLELMLERLLGFSLLPSLNDIIFKLGASRPATVKKMLEYMVRVQSSPEQLETEVTDGIEITRPNRRKYRAKVKSCKKRIVPSESYGLHLTDEAKIKFPTCHELETRDLRPWILYRRAHAGKVGAFGVYGKIGNVRVISNKSNGFMFWDRHEQFEIESMQGTIKKRSGMTVEKVKAALQTPKEELANITATGLICYKLFNLCGFKDTQVKYIVDVKDENGIYRLISRVKSKQGPSGEDNEIHSETGEGSMEWNGCFPPEYRAGVAERDSCITLASIEGRRRSVYSGAIGYLDVGGGGNFFIPSQATFSWSDNKAGEDIWRVGSGVTVKGLGNPKQACVEMMENLQPSLAIFLPRAGMGRENPTEEETTTDCSSIDSKYDSFVTGVSPQDTNIDKKTVPKNDVRSNYKSPRRRRTSRGKDNGDVLISDNRYKVLSPN